MSVNDVYKATVSFTAPEADGEMNFNIHYRTSTVNTPIGELEEAQDIAAQLTNAISLNYLLFVPTPVIFNGVTVVGVTNPTIVASTSSGQAGAGGANPLSYRSAPVAKLLSGLRGRSFNGRIYLMTVDESQQTGGVMLQTFIDSVRGAVETFLTLTGLVNLNEYKATIYSETLTGEGPIVDNLVQSVVINPRVGTQRSRQKVV